MRLGRAVAKALGVVVLSLLLIFVLFAGVDLPLRYEVPNGYQGRVVIQYKDANCPPLPRDGLVTVLAIDAQGRLCTSSDYERGWHQAVYAYAGGKEIGRAHW